MRLRYDSLSPFTGRETVLEEYDEISGQTFKMCMETGFSTYSNWISGSDAVESFKISAPDFVIDSEIVDNSNLVWFMSPTISRNVVLFPYMKKWLVGKLSEHHIDSPIILKVDEYELGVNINECEQFELMKYEDALFEFHRLNSGYYDINEN